MNSKQARHLVKGDVLAGSGFVVDMNAYRGVRTPAGKVVIVGYYPGSPVKAHVWNASTKVSTL